MRGTCIVVDMNYCRLLLEYQFLRGKTRILEASKLLSKLKDGRSHMCLPGGPDVTGRGPEAWPESETYEWVVIFSLLIEYSFKF